VTAPASMGVPIVVVVLVGLVARVGEDGRGPAAGVGLDLVGQRGQVGRVGGARLEARGHDDLVGLVDHELGVVAVDPAVGLGEHDPRVGVGEVALGLGLGHGSGWLVVSSLEPY